MNKYDRLDEITKLVIKSTVRTNEIVEELNVSDMTVRRDLAELEEKVCSLKFMVAQEVIPSFNLKRNHIKRTHTQYRRKRSVARKAIQIIEENDTIFLGPGTTIECLAEIMELKSLTVITNCFPVFKILFEKDRLISKFIY